jgi:hypothetical protein
MRKFVLFMIPLGLVVAQDAKPTATSSTKTTKQKAKPAAAPAPQPAPAPKSGSISIPPDAVEIGPQVYRHKDTDGKSWIYRKTPFGISKYEERPTALTPDQILGSPAPAAAPAPANTKIKVQAVDKGDTVRFEQLTPMGNRVWERKKSELTPEEKNWLEQTRNGSKDPAKPEN